MPDDETPDDADRWTVAGDPGPDQKPKSIIGGLISHGWAWLISTARLDGPPTAARYERLHNRYRVERRRRIAAEAENQVLTAKSQAAEKQANIMAVMLARIEEHYRADMAAEKARGDSAGTLAKRLTDQIGRG